MWDIFIHNISPALALFPPDVRYGDVKNIGMYTFPMGALELKVWPFVLPLFTIKIARQLSVLFNNHQRPLAEHGSEEGTLGEPLGRLSPTSAQSVEGRASGTFAAIYFFNYGTFHLLSLGFSWPLPFVLWQVNASYTLRAAWKARSSHYRVGSIVSYWETLPGDRQQRAWCQHVFPVCWWE